MKVVFVLVMLWSNPNGTDGHLVLKSDYASEADCIDGANHASKRADLLDKVPDDLFFECHNKADINPSWLTP